MSGFIQDPLQIINLIADNLRDRYRDDTAVIKEIIQNSDDARSARLHFVLVRNGLPSSANRLLRGPALVAVNDGIFRRRDARGVRQFGLSVKGADKSAIGKFGLGQKAVFHLCEAFLYLAEGAEEPAPAGFPYEGVVNPWSDVESHQARFADWDTFGEEDGWQMRRAIAPLGEWCRRFVLWLPLRSETQLQSGAGQVDPIVRHFPEPDGLIERLARAEILPACFPMVAHLREVGVHTTGEASGWRTLVTCSLEYTGRRLERPQQDDGPRMSDFAGRVAIRRNGSIDTIDYVGREKLGQSPRLGAAAAHAAWPIVHLRDDDASAGR